MAPKSYLVNSIVTEPGKDHMCPLTGMSAITDEGDEMEKRFKLDMSDLADKLADSGMNDLGLPLSLILDAWDACDMSDGGYTSRVSFLTALHAATLAYHDNQVDYTWNRAYPPQVD